MYNERSSFQSTDLVERGAELLRSWRRIHNVKCSYPIRQVLNGGGFERAIGPFPGHWYSMRNEPRVVFPEKAFLEKFHDKIFGLDFLPTTPEFPDLSQILYDFGLNENDLANPAKIKLSFTEHLFPLNYFDADMFEVRSVDEWLEIGQLNDEQFLIPGLAYIPWKESAIGEFAWQEVAIRNYKTRENLWTFLCLDGSLEVRSGPRIFVMFFGENVENFAFRVYNAVLRRREEEGRIRMQNICDAMPSIPLPDYELNIIHRLTGNLSRRIKNAGLLKQVEAETLAHVMYCHKALIYRYTCDKYTEEFAELISRTYEDYSTKMPLIKPHPKQQESILKIIRKKIKRVWLYVRPEVCYAMVFVAHHCNILIENNLLYAGNQRLLSLEDFANIVTSNMNVALKYVQLEWGSNIAYQINFYLRRYGKGWFDIKVSDFFNYSLSKLSRFDLMIRLRMEESLKTLVLDSLTYFVNLVLLPSRVFSDVADENFEWDLDLNSRRFYVDLEPLFNLQLDFDLNDNRWNFNSNINQFETQKLMQNVFVKLFDTAILASHEIHQIHPKYLKNMRFAKDLYLSSWGLLDPVIVELKDQLVLALKKGSIVLNAFANAFHRFSDFTTLSVDNYLETLNNQPFVGNRFKNEILYWKNFVSIIQEEIPSATIIGPYRIDTKGCKASLLEKVEQLYSSVCGALVAKLKVGSAKIVEEMEDIFERMEDKVASIEVLIEMNAWLQTIPAVVDDWNKVLVVLNDGYEVLDSLCLGLKDDEATFKWQALGAPHKVLIKTTEIIESFSEVEAQLLAVQIEDESMYLSTATSLAGQVEMFISSHTEGDKVKNEIELNNLKRALEENIKTEKLLLKRRKLFREWKGISFESFLPSSQNLIEALQPILTNILN